RGSPGAARRKRAPSGSDALADEISSARSHRHAAAIGKHLPRASTQQYRLRAYRDIDVPAFSVALAIAQLAACASFAARFFAAVAWPPFRPASIAGLVAYPCARVPVGSAVQRWTLPAAR